MIYDEGFYGLRRICCHCGFQLSEGGPWRNRSKAQRTERAETARVDWLNPYDERAQFLADYLSP